MTRTTDPRTVTITTTSASTAITGSAGTFDPGDASRVITGTGIPAGATLATVTSTTAAVLSAAATASGTVTATIGSPSRVIQDAQAYGFQGVSPEAVSEAGSRTVAATAAGVVPAEVMLNSTTQVRQISLP